MKKIAIALSLLLITLSSSQSLVAKASEQERKLTTASHVTKSSKVNLNTANAKQIAEALTGVGLKKAKAIVEYRTLHGEFKKLEDVAEVKGIGPATLSKNESNITFQ